MKERVKQFSSIRLTYETFQQVMKESISLYSSLGSLTIVNSTYINI